MTQEKSDQTESGSDAKPDEMSGRDSQKPSDNATKKKFPYEEE
jgi:hypothetical protein